MDTALKLATDYAEQYASLEQDKLPKWAVWQQKPTAPPMNWWSLSIISA